MRVHEFTKPEMAAATGLAVLYAVGTIVSGRSSFDPVNGAVVGSDTMVQQIRAVRNDDSIKAMWDTIKNHPAIGRHDSRFSPPALGPPQTTFYC